VSQRPIGRFTHSELRPNGSLHPRHPRRVPMRTVLHRPSMSRPSDHPHRERLRVPTTDVSLHPSRATSQRVSTPRTPTPCPCNQLVASPIAYRVPATICTQNAHVVSQRPTCRFIHPESRPNGSLHQGHPRFVPATNLLPRPASHHPERPHRATTTNVSPHPNDY
jgi:hypothetical protein